MKKLSRMLKLLIILPLAGGLAACAVAPPGSYYMASENPTPSGDSSVLSLGPNDQNYVLRIDDRTPFGLRALPQARDTLYNLGYDQVRRERDADFTVNVVLSADFQDNPNVRAGNMVGGALFGAATGAIIGGALGNPGSGAAIGAASGGALGVVAPAETGLVRIDVDIYSLNDRTHSQRSRTIDLTTVPPPDVHRVVDNEISRILEGLPRR